MSEAYIICSPHFLRGQRGEALDRYVNAVISVLEWAVFKCIQRVVSYRAVFFDALFDAAELFFAVYDDIIFYTASCRIGGKGGVVRI